MKKRVKSNTLKGVVRAADFHFVPKRYEGPQHYTWFWLFWKWNRPL
ncbi:unnamed protein product [marine sediment metagenome]|uniref:Uncharacterized protein n=1 Tax=marine sediment metagenome TaxID=412755 RepID=X0XV87_9ZZZZ